MQNINWCDLGVSIKDFLMIKFNHIFTKKTLIQLGGKRRGGGRGLKKGLKGGGGGGEGMTEPKATLSTIHPSEAFAASLPWDGSLS